MSTSSVWCTRKTRTEIEETLSYRQGVLVSITRYPLSHWLWVLESPSSAIHGLTALRRLRPLLDKDGTVADLRPYALDVGSSSIQEEAHR